jgi:flavin-dependent dehydrogenase
VPGGRLNIGIVMSEARLRRELRPQGTPEALVGRVLGDVAKVRPLLGAPLDEACVALPLASRVARRSGDGWLLVGDATGFIDPLSGEGIRRALLTAELAADAIVRHLRGDRSAIARYDRHLRATFARKDVISWVLQALLGQPALLDYVVARLASRDDLRRTFAGVMADLEPASDALSPRYLAALLRP